MVSSLLEYAFYIAAPLAMHIVCAYKFMAVKVYISIGVKTFEYNLLCFSC